MRFRTTCFVVMFFALTSILLFAAGGAQAVNLVTEPFTGATAPYTNWPISGNAAFITTTQADATSGTVVQLTPASNWQAGTLVYDKAFSSALTATITFNYFMGGGTGADGFSFFLVNGTTTTVTAGKSGGTLGYGTNYSTTNGVPNAYAAVGFDVYGGGRIEFGNAAGTGINNGGSLTNNVCIVGSGNLLSGYRYLTGSQQATIGSGTVWRKAEVIVKRGDGANGCALNGVCLSVRFSTDNGTTWTQVYTDYQIDNATGQATIPDTFKIGFSGSTGGSNNKHYIDNVQIDLTGAQLDVLKAGTGTGTVTSTSSPTQATQFNCGATCSVAYPGATAVTLTAAADASSSFTGWSGGTGSASCTGTGTCAVTLNANSAVTANFAINTYTVTTTAANGTITSTNNPTINYGLTTTVTGSAAAGYYFTGVSGCGGTTQSNTNQATTTFSYTTAAITGACTVASTFAIKTYTVTTTATNGTITSTNNPTVNHGSTTTVTGSANPNYYFTGVSGCGGTAQTNTNQATTTFSYTTGAITAACPVDATFAIKTYTLTYTAGANGSITGTSPQTVTHGANGTAVTAVPATGYHFVNWSDSSTANPRTDTGVTGNVTVTANFASMGGAIQGTALGLTTSNAVVTTFAGSAGLASSTDGTGSAARFNSPYGITTDGTNLFIADTGNHTIRKVVISTSAVTTLAGMALSSGSTDGTGSAALFNYPRSITTDGTNLFVADTYNHTIRKVVTSTGAVTTLAGTALSSGSTDGTGSAALFNYPFGITTDGTNLFVADGANHTIRKVVISTGAVTTLAGTAGSGGSTDGTGSAALFNWPVAITTDGTNLFVVENGNNTIRKVVISTGAVTTLAGTALSAGSTDGTGSAARFNSPWGITTDGTNLFVVENGNHTIRKVVISTGAVTTLAGTALSAGSTDGTGSAARFNSPDGITTDGTNLFIADTGNNTIRKVGQGLIVTTTATNGTITSTNNPAVNNGSTTTVTGSATAGYYFTGVSGCGGTAQTNTNQATTTFSYTTGAITAACTVTATFAIKTYTVTPSAGSNGTINPSTPQTINSGSTTAFTVTPNSGYTTTVGGTCGGNLVGTTYATNAITANCTVTASFTLNTYTVTPSAGAGGSIAPSTPQTINYGSTTTFTVTPNTGYTASVGGTCGGALVGTTYTTNAITANCTVAASFTLNTYTVTPSAGTGGSISPSTPQTVNSGATTAFTVTPNSGYTASVGGTCGGALVGTTYTTNAITANCTVTASFTLNTYTVTPSAGAGGTISPSTPQTINYGSTTTFTVTPNSGYTASVGGTCGGTLSGTTYTTSAITANCTVTASFTLNTYTVTPSAGTGGSISPSTLQTVNSGSTTAFTVTPNSGYTASVGGTCGGTLSSNTYTTSAITANCTVTATFTFNNTVIPAITKSSSFAYQPTDKPVLSADPASAKPIGLGSAASVGDTLSLKIGLNAFAEAVDLYIVIYAPGIDPDNYYLLWPDNTLHKISEGLVTWKGNVTTAVNESILGDIAIATLPPGTYDVYLMVSPAGSSATKTVEGENRQSGLNKVPPTGSLNVYYLWETTFNIQANGSGIPMPSGQHSYEYQLAVFPVMSNDPALAEPVSFGSVALDASSMGLSSSSAPGNTLNIHIGLNAFTAPVDIYIAAYVSGAWYILGPDNTFQNLEAGIVKWKSNQTSAIDESLFGDISTASLPSGRYNVYLFATPAGSIDNYYGWQTYFVIQ